MSAAWKCIKLLLFNKFAGKIKDAQLALLLGARRNYIITRRTQAGIPVFRQPIFTVQQQLFIVKNYKHVSNREIVENLEKQSPGKKYSIFSIRELLKSKGLNRTKEETNTIIARDNQNGFNAARAKRAAETNRKRQIGDIYYSHYGKGKKGDPVLCIMTEGHKLKRYEMHLYEQHFGPVPNFMHVVLKDPYGPIIPDNLVTKRRSTFNVGQLAAEFADPFIIQTLTHGYTKEQIEDFKNHPLAPLRIELQRKRLKLIQEVKKAENGNSTEQ